MNPERHRLRLKTILLYGCSAVVLVVQLGQCRKISWHPILWTWRKLVLAIALRYSRIRRPHALDFANLCPTFGHQAWWEVGATKRFGRPTGRQEHVCRFAHQSRNRSVWISESFPLLSLQAMFGSGQLRLWQRCSGLLMDPNGHRGLAMVFYQYSDISLSPVRSA